MNLAGKNAREQALLINVYGTVQGVGFRPYIYRLALSHSLQGWVNNVGDSVRIHVQGSEEKLTAFLNSLKPEAPAASVITEIKVEQTNIENHVAFLIIDSLPTTATLTRVSADIATCADCLTELHDPNNRRYHYPFINCTNCGPRFTIIKSLPYDRKQTSMSGFMMCDSCADEYANPQDRRFHAQPDACFSCGPTLSLIVAGASNLAMNYSEANTVNASDAIIDKAAELLLAGKIVAIKGLGGYHLACDATNNDAVELLRIRKCRPDKPFALMVTDLNMARAIAAVNSEEAELLSGSIRPIVLLRRLDFTDESVIATAVAGSLSELGIMLPATPLHHLLMSAVNRPLVMTSANLSSEPIVADVTGAHRLLQNIADAWLDNNRDIVSRYDDSVTRIVCNQTQILRRARGYAPVPLALPTAAGADFAAVVLAVGAEQKSCFCFATEAAAVVSQHLGDLNNADAFANYLQTISLYKEMFGFSPRWFVCDMHPDYHAAIWARGQANTSAEYQFSDRVATRDSQIGSVKLSGNLIEVQHHHAHIAAVLAENGLAAKHEVIGIALDGTGYGLDGSIWGGELLIASQKKFYRYAYLQPFPLPGGQAAILNPCRVAYALLRQFGLLSHPGAARLLEQIGKDAKILNRMIDAGINTLQTSSVGRLFDAVSALTGICQKPSYEGQAAIELEAALWQIPPLTAATALSSCDDTYYFSLDEHQLSPAALLSAILDDICSGVALWQISLRFHCALINALCEVCEKARRETGICEVALGGGVFMNRYLIERLPERLKSLGFTVFTNRELPANDGCIAYGQAAVALALLRG